MAEKKMYVVHTKRGYWIGAFAFKDQLRFAKIYTSLRFANEIVERIKRAYFDELSPKVLEVQLCLAQNAPTADVAPKSEVDEWYHEYHVIKDELKQEKMYHRETEKLADKYCAELQTAKIDVAREIFAEIEKWLVHEYVHYIRGYSNSLSRNFAELKKKYTEGVNEC